MTLTEYARKIDRILMCEAAWVCADSRNIKVFMRQPVLERTGRGIYEWNDRSGASPVLVMKYDPSRDLDLEEYRDEDGEIEWQMAKVRI